MPLFYANDTKIIEGIQRMDNRSYQYEKECYQKFAYLVKEIGVKKNGVPFDDALECYNDSIMAVILKLKMGDYVQKASLKTFIYQIFSNKCVDFLRKKTINTLSLENEELNLINRMAADSEFMEQENREQILRFVKKLNAKCQAILLLAAYYGFKDTEMPEYVNLKTGKVVSVTRKRCEEELRELYLADVRR